MTAKRSSRRRSLFSLKTVTTRSWETGSAFAAHVVVGDHGDVRVAELELAGEVALGIRGHVDDGLDLTLPVVLVVPATVAEWHAAELGS